MKKIDHLSPSQLCLYRSTSRIWLERYAADDHDWQDDFGPSMWRGSAVEVGLDHVLHGGTVEVAAHHAFIRFEEDAQGDMSPMVEKQRALIAPMLKQAIAAMNLAGFGFPLSYQKKIKLQLGVPWELIGYLDWRYEPRVVDLKTTEKLPSQLKPDGTLEKPKLDHRLQVSCYAEAEQVPGSLLYVTDKRVGWYHISPEEQADDIREARRIAGNIEGLLALSDDINKLRAALPLDPDNIRCRGYLKYLNEQAA